MTSSKPEPERCLALIFGASSWPNYKDFSASPTFKRSAESFRDYLLRDDKFGLPDQNLLYLFDSPEPSVKIIANINEFLYSRSVEMRINGTPASDIIVYYVGHGGFANQTSDYFLAIKSTQRPDLHLSSIPIISLARVLNEQARHLRRYVFLDSCFSAAAYKSFQSGPLDVAVAKTEDSFPPSGTALLCSSGSRDPSKAPQDHRYTMFTGALIDVLSDGDELAPPVFSLQDLGHIIRRRLNEKYQDDAVRPEVHAPAQKYGNVDEVPLFRNHFFKQDKHLKTKGTGKSKRAISSVSVNLRSALLGPLVGHTTDTTCRVWIQSPEPGDKGAIYSRERMTIGVVAVVEENRELIKKPKVYYFRLNSQNDRVGAFTLGAGGDVTNQHRYMLKPSTDYKIRVGVLIIDEFSTRTDLIEDIEIRPWLPPRSIVVEELLRLPMRGSEASFRTFPPEIDTAQRIAFMLGTYCYREIPSQPIELVSILRSIQNEIGRTETSGPPKFFLMFMLGNRASITYRENQRVEEIEAESINHYRSAFSSHEIRKLFGSISTYMVFDDLEITGNNTPELLQRASSKAALRYQWSHGPQTYGRVFYHQFDCAGYPFFVLDTRTQRYKYDQAGLLGNHMLGRPSLDPRNHPGQLQRLLDWLSDQQNKRGNVPKFIVTSSVFVPNDMAERIGQLANADTTGAHFDQLRSENGKRRDESDSWPAFPATRLDLLRHIVNLQIQNVVFLAGDIHCSNVAVMDFDGKGGRSIKAFSVTSSAFYWPFSLADGNPNNYVHDSRSPDQSDPFPVIGTDAVMHYRSFGYTQEDNFARLDVDKTAATLTVRVYDSNGNPVAVDSSYGEKTKENVLQLARW
jgi:alkaline phosphatase D